MPLPVVPILNAHYTSPTVIRAIYDAVEQMGFRQGNILEPSMGVGNFFRSSAGEYAGEPSLRCGAGQHFTGRIAKKLYPECQRSLLPDLKPLTAATFYDLGGGQCSFGDYKVNDKAYNKLGFSASTTISLPRRMRSACVRAASWLL
ncbi:MAG: hypothetical protein ACLUEF_02420 [Faecalibacterium prausnitzii]